MEWREVEIEPKRRGGRWIWIILGLAVLGVGAMVAGGLLAAWRTGALPIPLPSPAFGGALPDAMAAVEPVEGGMDVVVLMLPRPLRVDRAVLYLASGDQVPSSVVLPGEHRAVLFFVASGEQWTHIEVETPAGAVMYRR